MNGLPYHSTGARDDLVQRRFIAATLDYWNPDDPDFDPTANPVSSVYGGRMVDHSTIHLWTWDARPFPMFPLLLEVWSDGGNWETGHWLNGRLGALTAEALVAQVLADYAAEAASVGDLDGTVHGFLIMATLARRGTRSSHCRASSCSRRSNPAMSSRSCGAVGEQRRRSRPMISSRRVTSLLVTVRRAQEPNCRREISIGFRRHTRRLPTDIGQLAPPRRREQTERGNRHGAVLSHAVASALADTLLQDLWAGRATDFSGAASTALLGLEPADACVLDIDGNLRTVLM